MSEIQIILNFWFELEPSLIWRMSSNHLFFFWSNPLCEILSFFLIFALLLLNFFYFCCCWPLMFKTWLLKSLKFDVLLVHSYRAIGIRKWRKSRNWKICWPNFWRMLHCNTWKHEMKHNLQPYCHIWSSFLETRWNQ